jgi:DNA invertase Pin-like site-specific DNA recombinase
MSKIQDHHLNRQAYVYLRQSTPGQLRLHRESTERQYALREKAQALGWPADRIRILDRDLGQSGTGRAQREDFNSLVAAVAMGQVGAVFALEASRLARSNRDWHRLLELCAVTATLVIDEDGSYDPADFNDSLVLGLKGTFAQAELHIIRARLLGGKLNKARKGELGLPLPVGLVHDEAGRVVMDPDREVQGAVRQVFEGFARHGSAGAVVRHFRDNGLRFPRRAYGGVWAGRLIWGRLSHARVLSILNNPGYAGAYVFGRHRRCPSVAGDGSVRSTVHRQASPDLWTVLLTGHHDGYITWEQFLANRRQLEANHPGPEARLVPTGARGGAALLQGLLFCGVCGRRVGVRYTGRGDGRPYYECTWLRREGLARHNCLSVAAAPLDAAVSERLVSAVTPAAIGLALAALERLDEEVQAVTAQWQRRLERARYEVALAERRYEAVDPGNRLVAATLEERWNAALEQVRATEQEFAAAQSRTAPPLTAEQRQQVLALAHDFPRLWQAASTSVRDRKRMLRLLIQDITVRREPGSKQVTLHVRWQGGATDSLAVTLPPSQPDRMRYPASVVSAVRDLARNLDDAAIATRLEQSGQRGSSGRPFTASMVKWIRYRHRIPASPPPAGTVGVEQVCQRYGVSRWVVYDWIEHGFLPAHRSKPGMPYAITIPPATDEALRQRIEASAHLPKPTNPKPC